MKRSTRFLNRLFPWRQSSSSRSPPPSSSSSVASSRMASAVPGGGGILKETMTGSSSMSSRGGGGGHHRRTSPVDLHLGEPPPSSSPPPTVSQYAVPRPPPSPYEMVGPSSPPSSHQQQRFVSFPTTAERAPATTSRVVRIPLPPPMVIPQHEIEREELNALRQLASELHSALRLSEQENILLKGFFFIFIFKYLNFNCIRTATTTTVAARRRILWVGGGSCFISSPSRSPLHSTPLLAVLCVCSSNLSNRWTPQGILHILMNGTRGRRAIVRADSSLL